MKELIALFLLCSVLSLGCTTEESPCGEHSLNESWTAEDGCNTCNCTEDGIACTDIYCDNTTGPIPVVIEPDYEVHEWGIVVGCNENTSSFLTSRPKRVVMVKQPVIYVHANYLESFDLRVSFNTGKPTDTYPEAVVDGNALLWENVFVTDDCREKKITKSPYLPLGDIIPTLNDVDSKCLYYGDEDSRFLFYEGEMEFENNIEVTVNGDLVTIRNNGKDTVYAPLYIYNKGDFISPNYQIASFNLLKPREEKTTQLKKKDGALLIKDDMLNLGFTEKESRAFLNLWGVSILKPTNLKRSGHLFYRLSEESFDDMISTYYDPEPKKEIRALYALVDYPQNS